ncbi:hypothetical protein RR46_02044 [Papilio xuthus]|uniref:Uncharacterized protein n=1 Tax=Papilio xuthus TaxID=66420 RepID=A0A194QIR5_PAPXU|nr:hypothetical protein RR46_02044 [Papilio xuthus]
MLWARQESSNEDRAQSSIGTAQIKRAWIGKSKKLARLVRGSDSSGLRKNNPRSRWELPPLPNAPRVPHPARPAAPPRHPATTIQITHSTNTFRRGTDDRPSSFSLPPGAKTGDARARGVVERDGRLPPGYAFRALVIM